MKKTISIIIMFLFALCTIAIAEDVELDVNGKDLSEAIQLEPGKPININYFLEEGVTIEDVNVDTNSPVLTEYIKANMVDMNNKDYERGVNRTKTIGPYEDLPAGVFSLDVDVDYVDAAGNRKKKSYRTKADVPSSGIKSSLMGSAFRTAPADVIFSIQNALSPIDIPDLDGNLTEEELRELGLDDGYDVTEVDFIEAEMEGEIDTPEVREALKHLDGKDTPRIEKSLKVYKVTNKETGEISFISKILMVVHGGKGITSLEIAEIIPKEMANEVADIIFSEDPYVLEDDPVVKWNFNNIPPGENKEYTYTVGKKVEKLDSVTVARGNNYGVLAKIASFMAKGGWIIIAALLLIAIVGGPIMLIKRRGNKE